MADDIIEIVPDGDVILVVTKGERTDRFKVHSFFLRAASKVFASMLGPNFAEGQALAIARSLSSPCEVKLNNDDPQCMELILNIIHLKFDRSPQRLTSQEVIDLVILVDKYLLHSTLPLASSVWLIPTKDDDLHAFLRAALLLGHVESFTETTRLMMLHQSTSHSSQSCAGQDGIFFHTILKVEQKRDEIREGMMKLFNPTQRLLNLNHACEYWRQVVRQLYMDLDTDGPGSTRLRAKSLDHGFDMMSQLFNIEAVSSSSTVCPGHIHANPSQMMQAYERRLKELMKFGGLCLHCEQEEYKGVREGACKLGHKVQP